MFFDDEGMHLVGVWFWFKIVKSIFLDDFIHLLLLDLSLSGIIGEIFLFDGHGDFDCKEEE